MGVAALVLGIIGLVLSFWTGWIGALFGLVATILGAIGRKNPEKKGIATAGMVLGIITLVVSLAVVIICTCFVGAASMA